MSVVIVGGAMRRRQVFHLTYWEGRTMPRNSELRAYRQAMRDMAREFGGADYLCEMEYQDQSDVLFAE